MTERVTTISIRVEDRDWLQERQRQVSFERGKTIPMWDLMHEFIEAVRAREDAA